MSATGATIDRAATGAPPPTLAAIEEAVATLGAGPLDDAALARHVAPLFSRYRAAFGDRIYLANHSLGRPLDAMADDVAEALAAWYASMGDAWDAWQAAIDAHRARLARLLHAPRPDCVVPKTSAGQGLRAVLNTFDRRASVVATTGEFDSLDTVLREYARRGRIGVEWVQASDGERFAAADVVAAIGKGCDLVVVSDVYFATGQRLHDLPAIVAAAHAAGARVLVDVYHSLGAVDTDVAASGVDYAVGGSYKYLRGGPGACFLYVAPAVMDARVTTLDIGWFAKAAPMAFERPDTLRFAAGGDGWLESTPPIVTVYQARAGIALVEALGVARLRAHSLRKKQRLCELLATRGIEALGGGESHGAFVVVRHPQARHLADALADEGIVVDARGANLRICPDILTRDQELVACAEALAKVMVT
ncbi:MAG TPA: aminotransferase class V-fold PLP-dependent enzyme [Casimicrobiaceae bacterium]|nr:aminotransferase class V-fold PLP-dependent enzyme [Casimicrobiaceae bacterium]